MFPKNNFPKQMFPKNNSEKKNPEKKCTKQICQKISKKVGLKGSIVCSRRKKPPVGAAIFLTQSFIK